MIWKISEGGAFDRESATEKILGWPIIKFFGVLDKHIAHNEFLEKQAKDARKKAAEEAKAKRGKRK